MNYVCTYGDGCCAYCDGKCKNIDEMCTYRKEQITNADHMRSLSDEELAHEIMLWIMYNREECDEDGLKNFILNYLEIPYNGTIKEDF